MDNGGITPVMPIGNGYGDGFGGGSFMWIFGLIVLLALFNGGGFGGFNGNGNTEAIQADINRGFDAQNLQAQTRDILSAVTSGTAQSVAATNSTFHDTLAVLNDKYSELQRDIAANAVSLANVQANQNACCCDTKMLIQSTAANTDAAIAQNRYEAAMNTAAINATTTAQTQRILDALAQDKIEALQNQINALQLQNAVAGVVRYPSSTVYSSGCNPFCGCGCGNI